MMKIDNSIAMSPALLNKPVPAVEMARIEETARDFEAMFITEMLRPMFEGIKTNDMFGGGKGEEIFSSMLIDEYGKNMAAAGTLGIADQVKEQLIALQSGLTEEELARTMHNKNTGIEPPTGDDNV